MIIIQIKVGREGRRRGLQRFDLTKMIILVYILKVYIKIVKDFVIVTLFFSHFTPPSNEPPNRKYAPPPSKLSEV